MKLYLNVLDHMTKLAVMPKYGKNHFKLFFSRIIEIIAVKLDV